MKLNNNSNTVQATWLGIGSFVSFSFSILSAAILSRYLSKSDYGTYKQVLYVYNTLLIVFSLGLPRAYSYFLIRVTMEEGYSIVRKMNFMFLVLGLIFSLFLFSASSIFADVLKNADLKENLQLFSITPVFLLPLLGIESIMVTYKKAYINTCYVIFSRLFSLLCVVAPVVWFNASVGAAVVGFVLSSLLCCLFGLLLEKYLFRKCSRCSTTIGLKDILHFSLPLLVASFWGIIISSANQFFISRYWGNETFAEFSNGFIELPFASMILGATATVLLPVFSKMTYENSSTEDIVALWKSVTIKSAKIIYPLAIFCCVFADLIMLMLYGNLYEKSGIYLQIITFVNLIRIVPYAPVMLALGKVKAYAHAQMITALLIISLEYLSVLLFSSPYLIAIISVFCTLICVYLQLKVICEKMTISIWLLIPYKKLITLSLLSAVAASFSKFLISFFSEFGGLEALFYAFFVFAILYMIFCKLVGVSYVDILKSALKK